MNCLNTPCPHWQRYIKNWNQSHILISIVQSIKTLKNLDIQLYKMQVIHRNLVSENRDPVLIQASNILSEWGFNKFRKYSYAPLNEYMYMLNPSGCTHVYKKDVDEDSKTDLQIFKPFQRRCECDYSKCYQFQCVHDFSKRSRPGRRAGVLQVGTEFPTSAVHLYMFRTPWKVDKTSLTRGLSFPLIRHYLNYSRFWAVQVTGSCSTLIGPWPPAPLSPLVEANLFLPTDWSRYHCDIPIGQENHFHLSVEPAALESRNKSYSF